MLLQLLSWYLRERDVELLEIKPSYYQPPA
jgi:hypothetical protein